MSYPYASISIFSLFRSILLNLVYTFGVLSERESRNVWYTLLLSLYFSLINPVLRVSSISLSLSWAASSGLQIYVSPDKYLTPCRVLIFSAIDKDSMHS